MQFFSIQLERTREIEKGKKTKYNINIKCLDIRYENVQRTQIHWYGFCSSVSCIIDCTKKR